MDAHLAFAFTPDMLSSGGGAPDSVAPLRLHLGVCGSVAAYRSLDLLRGWQDAGFGVSVTLTPSALQFTTPLPFEALGADPVYTTIHNDANAVSPFAHLEPAQTARAMIIAPASATTMARLAGGMADELLACQALAFSRPLVLAPAMNPSMWAHPAVQANAETLRNRGVAIVEPGLGRTACGDMGQGRLADLRRIHLAGLRAALPQDMRGVTAMVTMGPTREHWDGVRFWTNPSTGTMGASIAVALWLRGATVHAVCGPGCPWLPEGPDMVRHNGTSARDLFHIASDLWASMDVGVFTAAVADFSPVPLGPEKFKKTDAPDGFAVKFTPNPDILRTLAADRRASSPQKVVGFAAETGNLESAVRGKLVSKKADIVVGNLATHGFGTADNSVWIADRTGREERWDNMPKPTVAWRLCSWLSRL